MNRIGFAKQVVWNFVLMNKIGPGSLFERQSESHHYQTDEEGQRIYVTLSFGRTGWIVTWLDHLLVGAKTKELDRNPIRSLTRRDQKEVVGT